ncbi:transglutaminase TgpA family protein [Neobacillus ginsengisoli]|uniref:Transglutaminase-like domain-containing protein n=1 Tax=Neobacillus ginsengisoli TaxID=904295 RepID=A0ABT9Y390_9BACI|nr:transglutaminaseTgpA domain-containing protein [Neobacillus ginsengisoli]MDQ0202196.1 hypothetical protein [Neobacillus ginsengisoli]
MKRNFPTFLLYAFAFLLLWEWLRPIRQLTNTGHMETFVLFLLISVLSYFLRIKWIWKFLINLMYIMVSINRLYYKEGFFHLSWLQSFFSDFKNNMVLLFARNVEDLSNELRTFLFFVLLWLMVYLINYWLLNRRRIFIFFFMTLVYITVLDTFTPYNAKAAVVRTVVFGFTLMGMLTFYRILAKENVDSEHSSARKWMVPLLVMIALSVLVGITAPKAAPVWPDPVPYLQAANSKSDRNGKSGPQRIGYGTNDSALGGPFIGDNKPVFTTEAEEKNYWMVETKDAYTGKGWISSGATTVPFREGDLVPVSSFPETVETKKETARVVVYNHLQSNHIMYPQGIQKILKTSPVNSKGNLFELENPNERILYYDSRHQPVMPNMYLLEFVIPIYKAADLIKTTAVDYSLVRPEFIKKYTQLPKELPLRVKQLAKQITAGKNNWFDKAKAVESYFSSSDYTYDQKNVAVPGAHVDYVDQFLFDTKRGYCDNFSTSMAVMLRTLGIPTRWVKGYTGGELINKSQTDPSLQLYRITNNNAHSWVEVFFPNQGWVPFEPTKGFSNDVIIHSSGAAEQKPAINQQTTPAPVKKPQQNLLEDTQSSKVAKKSANSKTLWKQTTALINNYWKRVLFILVLIAAVVGILYRIRGKWFPYFLLLKYRLKRKDENVEFAYLVLLDQLNRYGLKRKENQTLRSYAGYIDTFFSTREMTRLTAKYEQYLYHRELPHGTWKDVRKLWENLIKKTIA